RPAAVRRLRGSAAYARTHPGVTWLGCWAHARRGFFEAQRENPRCATAFLRLVARMYRRERAWDEQKLSAEERTKQRNAPDGLARTMNALQRLAKWVQARVLPKFAARPRLLLPDHPMGAAERSSASW
ncbi:MAG: hypothetical protein EXS41_08515, partial [Opitutaceae bacterium]|nr:hypothetical protein [Opitutaceae bacterium]